MPFTALQPFPGARLRRPAPPRARALPAGWVPLALRQAEAWMLAAVTTVLVLFALQLEDSEAASAWLAPVATGAAAAWAARHPAWRQRTVALRGSILVALLVVLTATPLPVGAAEVAALGYLAVLQVPWAIGLAAFTAGTRFLWVHFTGSGSGADFPALAAVGVAAALVAAVVGVAIRLRAGAAIAWRFDAATGLCNRAGLLAHAGELPNGARGTLAVIDCSHLLDARRVYGRRVARQLLNQLVGRLEVLAGEDGIAARTGAAEFSVLLPGTAREQAVEQVRRALGSPQRIEYDAGDSEIMLVPEVAIGVLGEGAELGRLQSVLSERLHQVRDYETRRRRHLRRERERHSRPPEAYPGELDEVLVRTVPMPLPAH